MSRKEFQITPEEYDELVALNRPGAGVSMQMDLARGQTIIETKTTRQLVTEWWQSAAEKYAIDWRTAKLDPANGPRAFTAEPKED